MSLSRAIINTLSYHDIFSYPLTHGEIYKYLIEKKINKRVLRTKLNNLKIRKNLSTKNDQYFLPGKENIVILKKLRHKFSEKKLILAIRYANYLKIIPTIKLVAISGALAMNNSNQNDDIDIFIISSKNSVWTTRLATILILHPFRRKPKSIKTKDKICLNMFLDSSIMISNNKNIYIAHEIAQLRPLWDRDNTYEKYINQNNWIKKYFPNWVMNKNYIKLNSKAKSYPYFEKYLMKVQLNYMRSKITTEQIEDKKIFFHPRNIQSRVLMRYEKKIKKLNSK